MIIFTRVDGRLGPPTSSMGVSLLPWWPVRIAPRCVFAVRLRRMARREVCSRSVPVSPLNSGEEQSLLGPCWFWEVLGISKVRKFLAQRRIYTRDQCEWPRRPTALCLSSAWFTYTHRSAHFSTSRWIWNNWRWLGRLMCRAHTACSPCAWAWRTSSFRSRRDADGSPPRSSTGGWVCSRRMRVQPSLADKSVGLSGALTGAIRCGAQLRWDATPQCVAQAQVRRHIEDWVHWTETSGVPPRE